MRRPIIVLYLLFVCLGGHGQSSITDSLMQDLKKEKNDTAKAKLLYKLSYYYQNYKPDSALVLAQSALILSQESHFIKGQTSALGQIARSFNNLGNFSKALEYYLEQLKFLEKQKDPESIASAYLNIALVYSGIKDIPKALYYAYKSDSISRVQKLNDLHLYTTLDLGDIYAKNNQLDSALAYTTLSYQAAIRDSNESITGTALTNMGNIYFKSGQFDRAIEQYKNSIPYLQSMQDFNTLSECYLGLAQSFDKQDQPDSALYYGERSFHLASSNQFLQHALPASYFLSGLYKQEQQPDSALAYLETYIALKDSFYNKEKIKDLQNRTISEQLRQDEIVMEKIKEKKERRLKLELLLVGMFIPVFFFISAFISRKKVHTRVIELSGIFSLIFLFEYITFLIHPVVRDRASHSPVIEIIVFVIIAGILTPAHHKVEYWLISKLTKKPYQKLHGPRTAH